MKRVMTTVLAAACGIACLAQEAPATAPKIDVQRGERPNRVRMERRSHLMRGMRGNLEAKPFGKLRTAKRRRYIALRGLAG